MREKLCKDEKGVWESQKAIQDSLCAQRRHVEKIIHLAISNLLQDWNRLRQYGPDDKTPSNSKFKESIREGSVNAVSAKEHDYQVGSL